MINLVEAVRTKLDLDEAAKTPHEKMRAQLGFPKSNPKDFYAPKHGPNESGWSKSGGHAGRNTLDRLRTKAKLLGFKKAETKDSATPDGSSFYNGEVYHHPDGHVLKLHQTYGATKYDNSFSAKLSHHPKTESVDLEEGRVKELAMDLDGPESIPHHEFQAKYGKSKDEFRKLLNPAPKPKTPEPKKVTEGRLGKDEADEDEIRGAEPMGIPNGPGKSPPLAPPRFNSQRAMRGLQTRIKKASAGTTPMRGETRKEEVELEEVHAPGTAVTIHDGGKRKSGKVVRHVPRNPHSGESEAYVVDTGEYESKTVPVHRVYKESVDLYEAAAPKYDPSKMDEFEAAKEYQYHAGRAAHHANTEGWNLKANIYNRDWKKELSYHKRHMAALKKVIDHHKKSAVTESSPAHETRQAGEASGLLSKTKSKVMTNKRRVKAGGETTASNIMQAAAGLRHAHEEVELAEGPSIADMHPDNINALIKDHGKRHMMYTGPGEPMQHGLGFKELKSRLGLGTSAAVHKKFVDHLEKNGFKSGWSHTSNEWVAHPK